MKISSFVAQMVGMRACYLFSRLVKALRQQLRPLLPDVLLRLQPHLARVLAHPLDDSAPSAKGVQGALAETEPADARPSPHVGHFRPGSAKGPSSQA
jgi:exportin-T